MNNFDKKLKGGLKKCPLHKFGANYNPVKDGVYQCETCKGYYKMPDTIYNDVDKSWRVNIFNKGNAWSFK